MFDSIKKRNSTKKKQGLLPKNEIRPAFVGCSAFGTCV